MLNKLQKEVKSIKQHYKPGKQRDRMLFNIKIKNKKYIETLNEIKNNRIVDIGSGDNNNISNISLTNTNSDFTKYIDSFKSIGATERDLDSLLKVVNNPKKLEEEIKGSEELMKEVVEEAPEETEKETINEPKNKRLDDPAKEYIKVIKKYVREGYRPCAIKYGFLDNSLCPIQVTSANDNSHPVRNINRCLNAYMKSKSDFEKRKAIQSILLYIDNEDFEDYYNVLIDMCRLISETNDPTYNWFSNHRPARTPEEFRDIFADILYELKSIAGANNEVFYSILMMKHGREFYVPEYVPDDKYYEHVEFDGKNSRSTELGTRKQGITTQQLINRVKDHPADIRTDPNAFNLAIPPKSGKDARKCIADIEDSTGYNNCLLGITFRVYNFKELLSNLEVYLYEPFQEFFNENNDFEKYIASRTDHEFNIGTVSFAEYLGDFQRSLNNTSYTSHWYKSSSKECFILLHHYAHIRDTCVLYKRIRWFIDEHLLEVTGFDSEIVFKLVKDDQYWLNTLIPKLQNILQKNYIDAPDTTFPELKKLRVVVLWEDEQVSYRLLNFHKGISKYPVISVNEDCRSVDITSSKTEMITFAELFSYRFYGLTFLVADNEYTEETVDVLNECLQHALTHTTRIDMLTYITYYMLSQATKELKYPV